MFAKIQTGLGKFVGPNAALVLDALIAFELTAAGTAIATPSARTYADQHPFVAVAVTFAPPLLTALASKFRKAATTIRPPK
jgi:hypothetical protein